MKVDVNRGEYIRLVIDRQGRKPKELGEKIGVEYSHFWRWLRGKSAYLTLGQAKKLAKELGLPLDAVIGDGSGIRLEARDVSSIIGGTRVYLQSSSRRKGKAA